MMMLGNLFYKSEEDRLCQKYSELMSQSFRVALHNKEKSDKIRARAKKILLQLKKMNCKKIDKSL
ncbi:Lacal_2735 family protein [Gillisia sp. Hel_I_29]|uniref:Lacal_2735 family protein n=1 Tax=Gillisia sp. Hel_I_29 TaxID=1249975 RepID=UPI000B1E3ADB|nr:Lacal_2735 family protein [Gillisia sp. Hel_I_29]